MPSLESVQSMDGSNSNDNRNNNLNGKWAPNDVQVLGGSAQKDMEEGHKNDNQEYDDGSLGSHNEGGVIQGGYEQETRGEETEGDPTDGVDGRQGIQRCDDRAKDFGGNSHEVDSEGQTDDNQVIESRKLQVNDDNKHSDEAGGNNESGADTQYQRGAVCLSGTDEDNPDSFHHEIIPEISQVAIVYQTGSNGKRTIGRAADDIAAGALDIDGFIFSQPEAESDIGDSWRVKGPGKRATSGVTTHSESAGKPAKKKPVSGKANHTQLLAEDTQASGSTTITQLGVASRAAIVHSMPSNVTQHTHVAPPATKEQATTSATKTDAPVL